MSKKLDELSPIQLKVLELYKQDRNVVNFDKLLLTRYWLEFDGWNPKKPLLANMIDMTSAESITRARRKLHELGLIQYSKEANRWREKRYREMQEEHSNFITRFWRNK